MPGFRLVVFRSMPIYFGSLVKSARSKSCHPCQIPVSFGQMYKLVVFVPEKALEKVSTAICSAGAGHVPYGTMAGKIGRKYDNCTFYSKGTGTFRPLKGARPNIGKIDKLEKVIEYRLETIVPGKILKKVITAMKRAHPYEEPAYDVYPLKAA